MRGEILGGKGPPRKIRLKGPRLWTNIAMKIARAECNVT